MTIEVRYYGPRVSQIVMIDGEPYPLSVAAEKLGLKYATLAKRIERGSKNLAGKVVRGKW
jgi:hypothetical protein